jgi:predicted peptidase
MREFSLAGAAITAVLCGAMTSAGGGDWQAEFKRDEFQSGGETLRYRLFSAAGGAGDTNPPLVVFLHGAGERGDDNTAQLKHGVKEFFNRQAHHPCTILAPQCPAERKWVKIDWAAPRGEGSFPSEPEAPLALTIDVIDKLIASSQVDPDRIYLTGLSMGGFGSWYAAAMPGSRFAAVAPVCGGGDPAWAARYVGLPIWAFHGSDDRAVPVARSREMIGAIRAVGGEPRYTEYPAVGHDSWTPAYADEAFHAWLFAQRRTDR